MNVAYAAPALVLHSGPIALLLSTLIMAGMAALTATSVLMVTADKPPSVLARAVLGVMLLVMINVSAVIGIVTPIAKLGAWAPRMQWIAVLIWRALIAWAAWRSIKAWRTLQHRPNPFLANPPQ